MKLQSLINENTKQAKQYVKQGKLSQEDFDKIKSHDPSKTNKYTGWMAKQFIQNGISINDLRNTIEEWDVFVEKNKTEHKDIYQYKSFDELKKEVDKLNQTGSGKSRKDLEEDYEVIIDNEDIYIAVPHTHEASRKLGLSTFSYRDCGGEEESDSAWCTTFKTPNHFNDYYYKHNVTFYYVLVRSKEMRKALESQFGEKRGSALAVSAIAVLEDGQKEIYDGLDNQLETSKHSAFLSIIGLQ